MQSVTAQVRRGFLVAALLAFSMCAMNVTTWGCAAKRDCPGDVVWDTNMGRCRAEHGGKLFEFVKDECCR